MGKESADELRERLIRDERVRQMIRVRAYEIYQMRGQQPGGQARDWFQAENEVLAFLMADQPQHVYAPAGGPSSTLTEEAAAPPKKKIRSRTASSKKPATKRATSKKSTQPKRKPARKPSSPKKPK